MSEASMTRDPDDTIIVSTTIEFDWRDRLRILLGRPVTLTTRTQVWCERLDDGRPFVTGITPPASVCVEPVLPRRRRPGEVVAPVSPPGGEG